jgi:hypothetical protein
LTKQLGGVLFGPAQFGIDYYGVSEWFIASEIRSGQSVARVVWGQFMPYIYGVTPFWMKNLLKSSPRLRKLEIFP